MGVHPWTEMKVIVQSTPTQVFFGALSRPSEAVGPAVLRGAVRQAVPSHLGLRRHKISRQNSNVCRINILDKILATGGYFMRFVLVGMDTKNVIYRRTFGSIFNSSALSICWRGSEGGGARV